MLRFAFLAVLAAYAPWARSQERDCSLTQSQLPEASVFIGYTRPAENIVRAAALVTQGNIEPYDGRHIAVGTVLYGVLPVTDVQLPVSRMSAYLSRLGPDHCVYQAQLPIPAVDAWRLWTSQRPAGEFRAPTAAEDERLQRYQPRCVQQGDLPEDQRPPCARAQLLAVSDLDADGYLEFWHSVPYTWDTGLSVLEETQAEPAMLVTACPGCSD